MPFPVGSHLKLEMRLHSVDGAEAGMLFYYTPAGGSNPEVGTIGEVANNFFTTLAPLVAACLAEDASVTSILATWNFGSQQFDGQSYASPSVGTSTGEGLPEEDAIVLQKRTGLQGRNKRGRWFLPFIPEGFQNHGELNATAFTVLNPLALKLREQIVDSTFGVTWTPVLADSKTGTWEDIIDVRIVNQVCNKRGRRNPKRLSTTSVPF